MKRFMILLLLVFPVCLVFGEVSFSTTDSSNSEAIKAATASVDTVLDLSGFSFVSLGIYDESDSTDPIEEVPLELTRDAEGAIKAIEDVVIRYAVKYSGAFDLMLQAGNPEEGNTGDVIHWRAGVYDGNRNMKWTGKGQVGVEEYSAIVIHSHEKTAGNYDDGTVSVSLETVDLSSPDQKPAKLEEPLKVYILPRG